MSCPIVSGWQKARYFVTDCIYMCYGYFRLIIRAKIARKTRHRTTWKMSCCRVLEITRYVIKVDWEPIIGTRNISQSDNKGIAYYHLVAQVAIS
ncbi:MAG: hypothetical protein DRP78_05525 [Candidatus Omnitrophota bacterium]|nr:MAG: hypothetical protein DRP78_05525 [Candidatus Omnitrophota bacterium]